MVLAMLACWVGGSGHAAAANSHVEMTIDMPSALWGLIDQLERQMPITLGKVEALTGERFREVPGASAYVHFEAKGKELAPGLRIRKLSMMLRPSLQFEDNSGLSMELQEGCITMAQVREHVPGLRPTQVPRGRSLDETTAWAVDRPWGVLTFAFQERQPDCLFRVALHRKLP
jgi:hypothetical protein